MDVNNCQTPQRAQATLDVHPVTLHSLFQNRDTPCGYGSGVGVGHAGGLFIASIAGSGRANLSKTSAKRLKTMPRAYYRCGNRMFRDRADFDINGYRITAPSVITADEILDIVKYKDGSRVSLYQGPPWAKSGSCAQIGARCL
jgi:hypothetical protein